jgi:hypothetical protein
LRTIAHLHASSASISAAHHVARGHVMRGTILFTVAAR